MKTTIYYFSGTGNSLSAARSLAKALDPCTLVAMTRALKDPNLLTSDSERIGIVIPVYFGGLPLIAARFLSAASFPKADYIFAVATCGNFSGVALHEAQRLLEKKGKTLSYGRKLVMPDNYLPFYNVSPEAGTKILEKTATALGGIAADITQGKQGVIEKTFGHGPLLRLWHSWFTGGANGKDRKFTVDPSCTSCGTCAKVCPMANVTMTEGRPQWQHRCEMCFACMQYCPAKAIQFGKLTRGKYRYHHPLVPAEDIAQAQR